MEETRLDKVNVTVMVDVTCPCVKKVSLQVIWSSKFALLELLHIQQRCLLLETESQDLLRVVLSAYVVCNLHVVLISWSTGALRTYGDRWYVFPTQIKASLFKKKKNQNSTLILSRFHTK